MHLPKLNLRFRKPETAQKDAEFRHTSVLRIMSMLLIGFLVFIIGVTISFAYQSVTRTIGQVQSIILLQSEINIEPIDFSKLERVREEWERKQSTSTIAIGRDPFNAVATTTSKE